MSVSRGGVEAGAGIPISCAFNGILSAESATEEETATDGARNKKRTGNSGVNREEGEERRNSERKNSREAGKSARLGRMHMSPDMCVTKRSERGAGGRETEDKISSYCSSFMM